MWLAATAAFILGAALCGCTGGQVTSPYSAAVAGSPADGKRLIEVYRCGECHTIPGIPGARGVFGPPLNFIGRRAVIGGNFANSPDNLERWIQSPPTMKPGTAMPELGVTPQQAHDIAAYLYTLQ
jgi:cytochrome c1